MEAADSDALSKFQSETLSRQIRGDGQAGQRTINNPQSNYASNRMASHRFSNVSQAFHGEEASDQFNYQGSRKKSEAIELSSDVIPSKRKAFGKPPIELSHIGEDMISQDEVKKKKKIVPKKLEELSPVRKTPLRLKLKSTCSLCSITPQETKKSCKCLTSEALNSPDHYNRLPSLDPHHDHNDLSPFSNNFENKNDEGDESPTLEDTLTRYKRNFILRVNPKAEVAKLVEKASRKIVVRSISTKKRQEEELLGAIMTRSRTIEVQPSNKKKTPRSKREGKGTNLTKESSEVIEESGEEDEPLGLSPLTSSPAAKKPLGMEKTSFHQHLLDLDAPKQKEYNMFHTFDHDPNTNKSHYRGIELNQEDILDSCDMSIGKPSAIADASKRKANLLRLKRTESRDDVQDVFIDRLPKATGRSMKESETTTQIMNTFFDAGSMALQSQENIEARSVTSKDLSINTRPLSTKFVNLPKKDEGKPPTLLQKRITHSDISAVQKPAGDPEKKHEGGKSRDQSPVKRTLTIAQKSQAYNKVNNVHASDFNIDRFKAFIFSPKIRKKNEFLKFLQEIKTDVDMVKMFISRLPYPSKVHLVQLDKKKKVLFLDLDETLVHTNFKEGELKDLKLSDICQRPYLDYFLKETSKWYNLVVFTASFRDYAEKILNVFDPSSHYIKNVLARENCTEITKHFIKDFNIVANSHVKKEDIIMLDNRVISYGYNMMQGVPILPFYDDPEDTELRDIVPFLKHLSAHETDAQYELKMRYNYSTVSLLNFTKYS